MTDRITVVVKEDSVTVSVGSKVIELVINDIVPIPDPVVLNPPANVSAPVVLGDNIVGTILGRDVGTWTNSPTSYETVWYSAINGTMGTGDIFDTSILLPTDVVTCKVVATNADGSSDLVTSSNSVTLIAGTPTPPTPDDLFAITAVRDQYIFNNTTLDLTSNAKHGILGTFVYGDPGNTFTGTINWGDGSPAEPVTIVASGGIGTITGSHAYGIVALDLVTTITATLSVTDANNTTLQDTFTVTAKNRKSHPQFGTDQYVVSFNPGTGGIGFHYVNATCTWEDFFANNTIYDYIELHNPAGHDGTPMELNQCDILDAYVASLPTTDPNYIHYAEKANWTGMRTGALTRNKWLMMYVGGCRWGFGFNAEAGETVSEYVARALEALRPVLECLPEVVGIDTAMGLQPSDLNLTVDPLAVNHANVVYGENGAEWALIQELERRGHNVVVEPYHFANATYMNAVGSMTAYNTWKPNIDSGVWTHNKAIYDGQATWTRTGNLITVTYNNHGLTNGKLMGVVQSSSAAATPLNINKSVSGCTTNTFNFTGMDAGATSGTMYYYKYILTNVKDTGNDTLRFVYCNAGVTDPVGYLEKINIVFDAEYIPAIMAGRLPVEFKLTGLACLEY